MSIVIKDAIKDVPAIELPKEDAAKAVGDMAPASGGHSLKPSSGLRAMTVMHAR